MVQNSKSKKAKQALKTPPVSNGCNDSEPQNVKNEPSKVEAKAGASKNHVENEGEMDIDSTVESGINGEHDNEVETEPETSSGRVRQPPKSRKKKAAEAAVVESSETTVGKGDGKSAVPLSKTKGRQRKGKDTKMDAAESTSPESPASEQPQAEEAEVIEMEAVAEPNAKPERDIEAGEPMGEAEPLEEAAEPISEPEAAEPEPLAEPIVPVRRGSKRKAAEPMKTEVKAKKSAKEKPVKPVPKTKTKKQKVLLSIPSVKSIAGKVFVIGQNEVGQLGFEIEEVIEKKKPAMLELPHPIANITAGGMHSVCLTEKGEVITFGCNDEGALGRVTAGVSEEATPRRVEIQEKIVQVSAGDCHTAALTESGQVYLWGSFRGLAGPIGLIAAGVKQVTPLKILTDTTIVKISSGAEHLVCLSKEGIVYTCGCGENGQLGRLSERACQNNGGRRGLAAFLEPAPVPVTGQPNKKTIFIEDIWTGAYNTILKAQETGLIYVFGLNNHNQLGFENENEENVTCYIPKQVSSFNSKTWNQITGGQHHTLALDNEGLVYAVGRKEYGRLGLGENCESTSVPTVITALENEKCSNIACGEIVSFAVSEEGSMYSWGMGTNYQLGHGKEEDCYVPCLVEGNFLGSWKTHKVSSGGQHTLILASAKESSKKDTKK